MRVGAKKITFCLVPDKAPESASRSLKKISMLRRALAALPALPLRLQSCCQPLLQPLLQPRRCPPALGLRQQSTTKITGFDIRVGDLLEIDKALWRVEKAEFSRKAQGAANVNVFLRHFILPQKKELRLSSTETIQKAVLDGTVHVSVLYTEGKNVLVMDATTFEQQEQTQTRPTRSTEREASQ